MCRLSPTTTAMQQLSAARAEWLLAHGVSEAAERVTSKANLWADMLSRGGVGDVLVQAVALGLRPRRVAVPPAWRHAVVAAARAREGHTGEPSSDPSLSVHGAPARRC